VTKEARALLDGLPTHAQIHKRKAALFLQQKRLEGERVQRREERHHENDELIAIMAKHGTKVEGRVTVEHMVKFLQKMQRRGSAASVGKRVRASLIAKLRELNRSTPVVEEPDEDVHDSDREDEDEGDDEYDDEYDEYEDYGNDRRSSSRNNDDTNDDANDEDTGTAAPTTTTRTVPCLTFVTTSLPVTGLPDLVSVSVSAPPSASSSSSSSSSSSFSSAFLKSLNYSTDGGDL
jgi:hypothetical protein